MRVPQIEMRLTSHFPRPVFKYMSPSSPVQSLLHISFKLATAHLELTIPLTGFLLLVI